MDFSFLNHEKSSLILEVNVASTKPTQIDLDIEQPVAGESQYRISWYFFDVPTALTIINNWLCHHLVKHTCTVQLEHLICHDPCLFLFESKCLYNNLSIPCLTYQYTQLLSLVINQPRSERYISHR